MAKFEQMMIIMVGLFLLFHITGIVDETPSTTLLGWLLDPSEFSDSPLGAKILAGLAGAAVIGTIFIGAVTRDFRFAMMLPIGIFLATWLWDMFDVFSKVRAENSWFALLLFAPLMLLWMTTLIDWVRGLKS